MNLKEYQEKMEAGEILVQRHGHRSHCYEPHEIGIRLMVAALDRKTKVGPFETTLNFPIRIEGSIRNRCPTCGKEPAYTIYEDRVEVEDSCETHEPFSVEIEFPTGDMIFNDTYPNDKFDSGNSDVGTIPGIVAPGKHMSEQGMLHFFVGNSCPTVWREGDTVLFGNWPEGIGERVGFITTDLWWATFVDRQTLENKGASQKEINHMRTAGGSVQVTPGTYRCTSYYHLGALDYSEDEKQIYGKLELIR